MGKTRRVDRLAFEEDWLDPALSTPEVAARHGKTEAAARVYARAMGLPKRHALRPGYGVAQYHEPVPLPPGRWIRRGLIWHYWPRPEKS